LRRPNAASLAAGRGTGDSCSSYGNRNFWGYFTDWFGSTHSLGADRITEAHIATGGNNGYLGSATSLAACGLVRDGCGQQFQGGSVYWSPATGAHPTSGAIRDLWISLGWEKGLLGYATADMDCSLAGGGCAQAFEGGTVVWSPATGARILQGAIRDAWVRAGRESGVLGYPSTDMGCGFVGGGCGQQFQGGSVYWSPAAGAHPVTGPIRDYWIGQGWERGSLGYASGDMVCESDGSSCRQDFQGQTVAWSAAGVQTTSGAIRDLWVASGAGGGSLGQPTAGMVCAAGSGCRQAFEGGTVFWSSATRARVVSDSLLTAYTAVGGESGYLGYPSTDQGCGMVRGGCGQQFQGGSVYSSPATGAHATSGAIRTLWMAQGWESGALGYPAGDMVCGLAGGGCRQVFQGGTVTWSAATGTRVLSGAIAEAWGAAGRESGGLGWPSTDMGCGFVAGGCGQQFQGGSVYWSPATGAHGIYGAIRAAWIAQGWQSGPLGYPTAEMVCGLSDGGCRQTFQGGTLSWTPLGNAVTRSR
jgi:uncharacterized protein with LGFP repeats